MASATGIRVDGLSRAVRDLQRLGVEVDDLKEAMARVGASLIPEYERVTPTASGRLAGDYRPGKAKGKAVLYLGRASIPYAGVINYGWPARNIRPAHFIERGDTTAAPKASDAIERELTQLIRQLNLN